MARLVVDEYNGVHSDGIERRRRSYCSTSSHVIHRTSSDSSHVLQRIASGRSQLTDWGGESSYQSDLPTHRGTANKYEVNSIAHLTRRLHIIQKSMEEGIDTMKCQIYQLRFCNKLMEKGDCCGPSSGQESLKERMKLQSPVSSKPRSARITTCRDAWYDSTRSGIDQSHDYCHIVQKPCSPETDRYSTTPIHFPALAESSDTRSSPPLEDTSSANNNRDPYGLSTPEETPDFGINHSSDTEQSQRSLSPHLRSNTRKGFKKDVVLDVQRRQLIPNAMTPSLHDEQSPIKKKSKLERLLALFSSRRLRKRFSKNKENRELAAMMRSPRKKGLLRGRGSRASTMCRRRYRTNSMAACKFTDKYPVEEDGDHRPEMSQCIDRRWCGESVEFESDFVVSSEQGTRRNYVLSADGIANGIACFDLTCLGAAEWCFIGVVASHDVYKDHRRVSQFQTAHGWSNQSECVKRGIAHFISDEDTFTTGTSIQVPRPAFHGMD